MLPDIMVWGKYNSGVQGGYLIFFKATYKLSWDCFIGYVEVLAVSLKSFDIFSNLMAGQCVYICVVLACLHACGTS